MLLLDILANADNNVQKASEKLSSMGYEKRDTTVPKPTNRSREEQVLKEKLEAENTPPPQPRLKSNEEKQKSELPFWFVHFPISNCLRDLFVKNEHYSQKQKRS